MFFVYMGIVFDLAAFNISLIIIALAIFLAIMLARYVSVKLLLAFDKPLKESKPILLAMMPRGLATAVLATLPIAFGLNLDFNSIVLLIVILTNVFATIAVFYFEKGQRKKTKEKKSKEEKMPPKKLPEVKIFDINNPVPGR